MADSAPDMWRAGAFEFNLERPLVMGVLNATPDSFSDGGSYDRLEPALGHARRMLDEGADIIDVGGESTRPGAAEVSIAQETMRVLPVVTELTANGVAVSIDTRHAQVAQACVDAGACIINDVSGFADQAMVRVAAACDVGVVVMHMLGEPGTMQHDPHYDDVVTEVVEYLEARVATLVAAGV
nr:dihydropteroate synthase [Actinomycetota bacterium]